MRINLAFIVPGRWLVCDLEDTQGVTSSLQPPKPRPPQDRQGDPGWSRDECYLCGPLQWCGGECFHSSVSPHCSRWCRFGLPVCHSCLYYNWRAPAFEKDQLHSLLRTWTCGQHLTCFGWSYCKHSYKVFFATKRWCFTSLQEDPVKYYTWRTFGPNDQRTRELWVDMSDIRRADVRVHGVLSNSYKQAVVSLINMWIFI